MSQPTPYQSYVQFCERLGITPMDELRWRLGSDAMPNPQQGLTTGRSAARLHADEKRVAGK